MKLSKDLITKAEHLATLAAREYQKSFGENPMGCGFAWVEVKNVRGNNAKLLKENGFNKNYTKPGLSLWDPACMPTQDMDIKMAGALAYAGVLKEAGLDAQAVCRLD